MKPSPQLTLLSSVLPWSPHSSSSSSAMSQAQPSRRNRKSTTGAVALAATNTLSTTSTTASPTIITTTTTTAAAATSATNDNNNTTMQRGASGGAVAALHGCIDSSCSPSNSTGSRHRARSLLVTGPGQVTSGGARARRRKTTPGHATGPASALSCATGTVSTINAAALTTGARTTTTNSNNTNNRPGAIGPEVRSGVARTTTTGRPWAGHGELQTAVVRILNGSRRNRLLPLVMLALGLATMLMPVAPSASAESFSDPLYYDQNSNGTTLLQLANVTNGTGGATVKKDPLFPKDLFTDEQLRSGAIMLHVIGVIYMFVALAIVCDEFFVPSLDVIIEKLGITDDVAGATFMAAGGSAPELFTSIMGVFVSFNDVGIGTIVGSAVFNILFVIGMCALFSKTILSLTWWPLFRDCTFYSVSLLTLIYFFRDNKIYWWEALVLFIIYILYAVFMKFNQQVERCVKKIIYKNKVTRVRSTDQLMPAGNAANSSETSMATQPGGSVTSRAASESRSGPPGSSSGNVPIHQNPTATGAKFRHGLLQLMIHTIDPLHDGKVDEKATQLHAIASLKVLLDATKPQRGAATSSAANHVKINLKETTLASDRPNGNIDTTIDSGNELEEEPPEALSMSWPKGARKRITYLLVAPIIFPLYLTLPDTRTPRGKRFFPVTFIGSILWIAAYSYLMVWWATVIGDTSKIPPEVMGLTFLAAGTSIPDLITSVIVARKGFGDMAVSSSVGSNIFDVTVGLPIPWLLYGMIYGQPVEVNSVGMVCSITILFLMLLFVVMSIACFRWRMNKGLGFTMFMLYFAFVAVSLMFEYDVVICPF
ncbi:sodium/potassium/calcium exchanger Nckx30C-like isoform X2 [Anopheles albimanus]|uniref:sodium/potassium/calcium exchanger Nckx30C-like isoform X2 n=1 Tax=Anopheles albimanus TaxID=7167 RepID=UPI001641E0E5|nr:sodium/potassium/calcium exchanger Nckx30C-like isoform X2 [Anopheles albimanus]